MTKQEALQRAEAARHAAKVIAARVALYATTFGGADKLTQDAMMEHDVAIEVHHKWLDVAQMHPRTRARLIRTQALPAYMFAYTPA